MIKGKHCNRTGTTFTMAAHQQPLLINSEASHLVQLKHIAVHSRVSDSSALSVPISFEESPPHASAPLQIRTRVCLRAFAWAAFGCFSFNFRLLHLSPTCVCVRACVAKCTRQDDGDDDADDDGGKCKTETDTDPTNTLTAVRLCARVCWCVRFSMRLRTRNICSNSTNCTDRSKRDCGTQSFGPGTGTHSQRLVFIKLSSMPSMTRCVAQCPLPKTIPPGKQSRT